MLVKFLVGNAEELTKAVVADPLISTFLTPETVMLPVKLAPPWSVGAVILAEKAEALVFKSGGMSGAAVINHCIPLIVETVEDKPFILAVQIIPSIPYSNAPALQLTYSWPSGERGNFMFPTPLSGYDPSAYASGSGAHTHGFTIPGSPHTHTTSVSSGCGVPSPSQQPMQNLPSSAAQSLSNAIAQSLYGNSGPVNTPQSALQALAGPLASGGGPVDPQLASGPRLLGSLCATNPFLKKLLTKTKKGNP